MKPKHTTAQHEKTGEIRQVLVIDGVMHFDLGCASRPVTDKHWIEQQSVGEKEFWMTISAFFAVMIILTILGARA